MSNGENEAMQHEFNVCSPVLMGLPGACAQLRNRVVQDRMIRDWVVRAITHRVSLRRGCSFVQ